MRDPDRIDDVLAALAGLWKTQPDIRLGQLLINVCRTELTEAQDIFYVEDHKVLELLKAATPKHGSPFAKDEKCRMCAVGRAAYHKVGEEDARPGQHNYTAYLCCWCFGLVMGKVAESECDRAGRPPL